MTDASAEKLVKAVRTRAMGGDALRGQSEVLEGLLSRVGGLADEGKTPVVLFDLDDTLLSTARRHLRILKEFTSRPEIRTAYTEQAFRLAQIEAWELRYSVTDSAKAAGIEDEALLNELRGFWFDRFFKNEYLLEDDPLQGAAEFCRDVAARGGVPVYMTGRDEAMRRGTEQALAVHGFPAPDDKQARLILKPRFDTPDIDFKTEALRRVAAWGPVAGGFENEPSHVNLFQDSFPGGLMVFIDTKHSGRPVAPHPTIPWIRDFRRL